MQRDASAAVFMRVREKELWIGANHARRRTRGEGRDERTQMRTKKEYCFVLVLFLCDGAATLPGRGFMAAAVVDGKVYSRRHGGRIGGYEESNLPHPVLSQYSHCFAVRSLPIPS